MHRLDITLRPSRLPALWYSAYVAAGMMIALHWQLPVWLWVSIVMSALLGYVLYRVRRIEVKALGEYPFWQGDDEQSGAWQLRVAGRYGDELWRAELDGIKVLSGATQLDFWVIEPSPRQLTVVIYNDELDAVNQRRLRIRTRFAER